MNRFGRLFWPLIGLSSVFSAIGFGLLIVAFIAVLAPIGLANIETVNDVESLNYSTGTLLSTGLVALVIGLLFVALSGWQHATLILRLQHDQPVAPALRAGWHPTGRVIGTSLLSGLISAGPMLLVLTAMIFTAGIGAFTDAADTNVGVMLGAELLAFFGASVWAVWAGTHYSMATFQTVLHGTRVTDSLRASWGLVHPQWWRIWLFPVPLSMLVGVASNILKFIPLIGSFAVFVVGTPAMLTYQYEMWRALQPSVVPPAPPAEPIAA